MLLLLDLIMKLACIWTKCVRMLFWNYVASTTEFGPRVVIIIFELQCMSDYLWTLFNMWCVYAESYTILAVCGLFFKTLHGTRWTTGFICAQVWECDYLGRCHCTCALINWTVLW
jgi:hypothetical protein